MTFEAGEFILRTLAIVLLVLGVCSILITQVNKDDRESARKYRADGGDGCEP